MKRMTLVKVEKDHLVLRHYTRRIVKARRAEISHYVRYYETGAPACRLGWLGEQGPLDIGILIEVPEKAVSEAVMLWLGHDMKQGQAEYRAEVAASRRKEKEAEAARQAKLACYVQLYMRENPEVFSEPPTWENFKEKVVANGAAKYLRTEDAGGYNTYSKEIRFSYAIYTLTIAGKPVELAFARWSGDD